MNKVCSNDVAISPIKIMSNKVRRKNGFFAHRNYAENVRRSNDFLPIEIKSIKESRNDLDILLIKIPSNKTRPSSVETCRYFVFNIST